MLRVSVAHATRRLRVAVGTLDRFERDDPNEFSEPFDSGLGTHDVHYNQGDPPGRFWDENGVWQDGATVVERPNGELIAILTKFATQSPDRRVGPSARRRLPQSELRPEGVVVRDVPRERPPVEVPARERDLREVEVTAPAVVER